MLGEWLNVLKQEENKHNTAAALREVQNRRAVRPAEKRKTRTEHPSKTSKTTAGHQIRSEIPETPITPPSKTSKTREAQRLGLVATWSHEFGFVSIHDPLTGEWHDLPVKDAPAWAISEAHKRKELYRDGNRKAYRLTACEMEEIWETEHLASEDEGIVEDHPLEEER